MLKEASRTTRAQWMGGTDILQYFQKKVKWRRFLLHLRLGKTTLKSMEGTVRQSHLTLSCVQVCGQAIRVLLGALTVIGCAAGGVEPLILVQVLVRASVERRSLDAIAKLAVNVPSAEVIRTALMKLLPATSDELEPVVVKALQQKLPKSLSRRPRTMAIDFHNKPYYGDKKTPGIFRGQPKASTKNFFAYASLLVIRKGLTFTVALVSVVNGEELTTIIDKLLRQAKAKGIVPRRLLLDRGFYAAKVMMHLQENNIPYVMPMIRRGKSGKTKKDCTATAQFFVKRRRGWATYTWKARPRTQGRQGPRTSVTTEVCMVPQSGKSPLVFACFATKPMAPKEVAALYRRRFRIETSYRQMHEGLALTCSKNPVYRLLLVLIAFMLRNLWLWIHWTLLADRSEKDERKLRLELMRARTMLHWLLRCLDNRLGMPKTIDIPSPAGAAG
jgi:hypothetical protein